MREMTQNEINEIVSAKSYASRHTVKRIWNNIVELILSELKNIGIIRFENFGKFEVVRMGGKDEWFINELGAKEKRWVDFYLDIKFTPSENLLKYLNADNIKGKWSTKDFKEDNLVAEKPNRYKTNRATKLKLAVDEDMRYKIDELAERKLKVSKRKVPKKAEDCWATKIKCLDNDTLYNSIRQCAKDLDLNYQNLNNHHHKHLQDEDETFEFGGYCFEIIKNKKIGDKE